VSPAARALRLAGALAITAATGAGACRARESDADLQPPADFTPPPVRPLQANPPGAEKLGFGRGFYPIEVGSKGETWRWMEGRGEVRLPNRRARCRLRITGWIPLEFLTEPPTIRISLQDHLIDRFRQTERALDRQYLVAPDLLGQQASVLLVLETSHTGQAPRDPRDLGLSIEKLSWDLD
jgi:hypothetical protein